MLIIGFMMIMAAIALFVEIANDILEEEKFQIDQYFLEIMWKDQENVLHQIMSVVTEAGSVLFIVIAFIVVVLILFWTKQNKWVISCFLVNMIGISLLTKGLKLFFKRDRPAVIEQFDGIGFSFPSGHSTLSIAFYGFLIYLLLKSQLRQWLKWLLIIPLGMLAIAIPFSRVVLGVHYFTDIVAGMALSFSWLILCIMILEFVKGRKIKT